jgi:glycerophosphoryl diester phosphodiesterase
MTQQPQPSGPSSSPPSGSSSGRRRALAVGAALTLAAGTAGFVALTTRAPQAREARAAPAAPAAPGAPTAPGQAAYGLISAHRGGDWGPDNSLAAFEGALAADLRDIEGDVHFTTDDVAVLGHDDSLSACGQDGTVSASSWAQLEQVRCSGEPLARLSEVAAAFRGSPNRAAVLRVELKHPAGQVDPEARADAALLVSRLVEYGVADRSVVQDFEWRTTAATVHAALGTMRLSCLESEVSDADVAAARSEGCYDVSYDHTTGRDGLNESIHGAGMRVAVWTVDSPDAFAHVRDEGADVIITDSPEAARDW